MQEYPLRWITDQLAVGYAPRSHKDLQTIRTQEISAIMNLCAECYDLHETEENEGFDVYYLPIHDEEAPDIESLENALNWLEARLAAGNKVLVHCRFGIGRTGTFVAAYLLRIGHSLKSALRKMKHTPALPMSINQWKLLEEYGKRIGIPKAEVAEIKDEIIDESDTFFKKWATMLEWFKN